MAKRNHRGRKDPDTSPPVSTIEKISGILDIPPSALSGIPQIEISGNREAVIEGCKGILEYDENIIRLTTGKMSVRFTGRGLQIKVLTHDSAVINGFINMIEFLT